jgi:hypothetical protein
LTDSVTDGWALGTARGSGAVVIQGQRSIFAWHNTVVDAGSNPVDLCVIVTKRMVRSRRERGMDKTEKKRPAGYIGTGEAGMESRLQDPDLWMLPPELRLKLGGEEDVDAWHMALPRLRALAELAEAFEVPVVNMVMRDAIGRSEEALERACQRAEGEDVA